MRDIDTVQVPPLPQRGVRPGQFDRFPPSLGKSAVDQFTPRSHRIGAKPRIECFERGQHGIEIYTGYQIACFGRDDRRVEALQKCRNRHFVEQGFPACRMKFPAPTGQHSGSFAGVLARIFGEQGDEFKRWNGPNVMQEGGAIGERVTPLFAKHFVDAIVPEGIGPGEAQNALVVRILRRQVHRIGRSDPTTLRIEYARHVVDRLHPGPVERSVARRGKQAVMTGTYRREPDGVPAGITIDIGVVKIGRGNVQPERLFQTVPILCQIDRDNRETHVRAG